MKIARRDVLAALALSAAATTAAACGTSASGETTSTLRYQGSAGQVTPAELAADLGFLGPVKLKWVGNTISGPQDIQSAATGQTDFGGAFNGAVIKLVQAGAPITAVIGYYGVDRLTYNGFFVPADSPIRTVRDLVGKKIGMNTLGAHSEAVLDIYLQRNGFSPADIKKVEPIVVPPVSAEQALRAHRIDVGVLSGVFQEKAKAAGGLRELFDDHQFLGDFTAGSYVFRKDFIKRNPATVRAFTTGVGKAIDWARTTPRDQVVQRFEQIIRKRGRNEDTAALKYWKSYGVGNPHGAIQDREITTWITWLEQAGQIPKGKVKAADIYTNRFNGG
ncbi:alkanesulfonate transporter substrate-binding subunit [Actinomadura rubteroloni]|uniref:Alkanesulfonate transporter substrate-binding subunit n=1 Tax=Actinomadura rubteroloni TaxID=1926885 RepID=A0A2P4UL83_9ACTN|nr:ABC transporter substrate-binding protein [Actinomadura rubteroloni]POM25805.1 alkanesulfonate transporter substrate-binding subunit [Actinomadura rubteroloni]